MDTPERVDPDPLLTTRQIERRTGIKPSTWRPYVKRGQAPPPDDPDDDPAIPPQRRRPLWRTSTIDTFMATRTGPGHRTDLDTARAQRRQRDADDLAAPTAPTPGALQAWLATNHTALLAAAELLVDHRDDLIAAVRGDLANDLAAAIDQAGAAMDPRPSRALASAVSFALWALGPDGPVDPDYLDPELRSVLTYQARLRTEYEALRPPPDDTQPGLHEHTPARHGR